MKIEDDMKKTLQYMLMLCTVLFTSCNLFIDEDLERELMEYSGKGYDKVVSDSTDTYNVSYQYKKSTMELNADNPLTQHIVRFESIDSACCHIIYFDGVTPEHMLPKAGQHIVSTNLDLFPFGLCDLVCLVEKTGGEYMVTCKGVDVKEAFDYLQFKTTFDVNDYLDEYDIYDEDGNFLAHVDNREENAAARTRSGDGDDYINVNIEIPSFESDAMKKKYYTDRLKLTLTGGLKGKLYAECDFDWDDGLQCKVRFKDGEFSIGLKIEATGGMAKSKKICGNDDLLNGKVKFNVGPVVVVPVFGFSLNYQIHGDLVTEVKFKQPLDFTVGFDGSDFYAKNDSKHFSVETKFEAAANLECPIVKISLGFGLFSSDLSLRLEIYAQWHTKAAVATGLASFFGDDGHPHNIDFNPKLTSDVEFGFAVALVAKGMIIKKVLEKLKEHVKQRTTAINATKNYFANGSVSDWVNYKEGDLGAIEPKVLDEMMKCLGGTTGEARRNLIDEWIRAKSREAQSKPKMPESEETGHVVPGAGDDDKEFALRLGPVWLDKLKIPVFDRYIFPKMKDGSFKVGQKWTGINEDIIFSGEWTVEDPGLLTYMKTLYPCFTIMSGSDELFTLFPENEEDAKLTGSTANNKKYKVEIPHLLAEYPYTCIPGYALEYDGRPVVQDKGLAFSTVTPTISIVKLVETGHEAIDFEVEGTPFTKHHFYFDTYSNVKGSVNIKEWGIYDNNDINPLTARHKSSSATLQSGNYIHHWTVNTLKTKVQIDLSPYIFGRDASNTYIMSNAKLFPAFKKKLKYEWDFTDDSRRVVRVVENDNGEASPDERDYELILDSVTYEGVRIM